MNPQWFSVILHCVTDSNGGGRNASQCKFKLQTFAKWSSKLLLRLPRANGQFEFTIWWTTTPLCAQMSWHSSTLLQTAKKAKFDDSRVFDDDHEVTEEYKWRGFGEGCFTMWTLERKHYLHVNLNTVWIVANSQWGNWLASRLVNTRLRCLQNGRRMCRHIYESNLLRKDPLHMYNHRSALQPCDRGILHFFKTGNPSQVSFY